MRQLVVVDINVRVVAECIVDLEYNPYIVKLVVKQIAFDVTVNHSHIYYHYYHCSNYCCIFVSTLETG